MLGLTLIALHVGPFALPLIWRHPRLSRGWKASLTILIPAATALAVWLCFLMLRLVVARYREMRELLQAWPGY